MVRSNVPLYKSITLDRQTFFDKCDHCRESFQLVRGSVFEDGQGVAIYLAAMHGCSARLVDLAIAIRAGGAEATDTLATFMKVRPHAEEIQMTVIDPADSFWQTEGYLGRLLTRSEALANPLITTFFQVADQIVTDIPELKTYLEAESKP